jgi:hypothetical protein
VPQRAKILPTATTCQEFRDGTAQELAKLEYSATGPINGNGTIDNVSPGAMFYFTRVTVDGTDSVTFDQENLVFNKQFAVKDVVAYDATCRVLFRPTCEGVTNGDCTVNIPDSFTTPTDIIFRVRYEPKSIIGAGPVSCVNDVPQTTDSYTITTEVNGVAAPGESDSIPVSPKSTDRC